MTAAPDDTRERELAELRLYREPVTPDASNDYIAGALALARADRADPEAAARRYLDSGYAPSIEAKAIGLLAMRYALEAELWRRHVAGDDQGAVVVEFTLRGKRMRGVYASDDEFAEWKARQ